MNDLLHLLQLHLKTHPKAEIRDAVKFLYPALKDFYKELATL